jgi:hypothetical protein
MNKTLAIVAVFLIALSGVYAWGEGNASQTYFIHWQPQSQDCVIPGTFLNSTGYLWFNGQESICIPLGSGRFVSQVSGHTISFDETVETFETEETSPENTTLDITGNIIVNGPYTNTAYVLICNVSNMGSPISYDWDFGDGSKLYDLLVPDVYHIFRGSGEYHVTCVANDEVHNFPVWTSITVDAGETEEGSENQTEMGNQTGNNTEGNQTGGNQTGNNTEGNQTSGNQTGNQTSGNTTGNTTGNSTNVTGNTTGNTTGSTTGNQTASVFLSYEQHGASFHFLCQESNFDPTSFDWDFGDGSVFTSKKNKIVHVYHDDVESHIVSCTASDNTTQATDFVYVTNE